MSMPVGNTAEARAVRTDDINGQLLRVLPASETEVGRISVAIPRGVAVRREGEILSRLQDIQPK